MTRPPIHLSLAFLLACSGGAEDAEDETGDEGGALNPSSEVGVCVHYGGPDSQSPVAKNCLEATGMAWTVESFQVACEQHWDAHGTHEADDNECPVTDLVGTCTISNGGALIGASYEGEDYSGVVFYYPESHWDDPQAHCQMLGGSYSPAG